jgi:hypothetical protein
MLEPIRIGEFLGVSALGRLMMPRSEEAEEIATDLNQYYIYYDLIYKDLDGTWKQVNAEVHYGQKITRLEEITEFYRKFLRGREDWNLQVAVFSVEIDVIPYKFI